MLFNMKARVALLLWSLSFVFMQSSLAMESGQAASGGISMEDYGLYGRVIMDKFLTSQIQLVLLERMTVARLVPNQDGSMTMAFFREQGYFDGLLPQGLIQNFVGINQARSRLEDRFQFGVRYRFVSGEIDEDSEARAGVSVKNGRTMPVQASSVLDRLAFSRVGRTLKDDQALVYAENMRPDGTGAGFLVWFRRQGEEWEVFDTDVVWTIHGEERGTEGP
jgi:hypothetical protein